MTVTSWSKIISTQQGLLCKRRLCLGLRSHSVARYILSDLTSTPASAAALQRVCASQSSFWFPIIDIYAQSTGRLRLIDRRMLVYKRNFGCMRVPCIVYLPPCQSRSRNIFSAWSQRNTLFSHCVFDEIPVKIPSWGYPAWGYNARTVAFWKERGTVRPLPVPELPVKSDGT